MNMSNIGENRSDILRFQLLRALFVCGWVLSIVLTFVPSYRIRTRGGGFFDYYYEYRLLSGYDIIQLLYQEGELGLWMLFVLLFAVEIVFVVLAFKYPKQLVFIAGATFAALNLLLNLFSTPMEGIEVLLIPRVLGYIATAFILSGFFIKPPATQIETKIGGG